MIDWQNVTNSASDRDKRFANLMVKKFL